MVDTPLRILIVEDRADDAELVIYHLHQSNLQFDWQRVETEAAYLEAIEQGIDVILSDYNMPTFNALRALELLQERGLDIPFIVVTGTINEETAVDCIKRGATDYLLKDRLARLGPAMTTALADKKLRDEKLQAETALQKSEERFRALIENAVDYFTILNADGTFQYSSPSVRRGLGYAWEELENQPVTAYIHPDDLPKLEETLQKAMAQPGVAQPMIEMRRRHKNGSWRFVEAIVTSFLDHPALRGIVINSHDVTQRQQAEEARRSIEERLRAVVASLPVIVFAFDRDETLTLIEGQSVGDFGLETEEITGQRVEEAYQHGLQIVENYRRALAGESFVSQVALPEGQTFEVYYSALHDRDGTVSGAIGVAIDITERKMGEEALRTAELLQLKLDKEKEIGQLKSRFVSLVSHEFRTPLTTIMSSSYAIRHYSERLSPERRDEHLQRIQDQVMRLSAMLDDILTIGKAETIGLEFNPVLLNLEQLCRDAIAENQSLQGNNHTVVFTQQAGCPEIYADQKLLLQALSNLISNAIKYSPEGGRVYLSLTCNSNNAILEIRDEGIGIPDEDMEGLFEIFHRGRNTGEIPGTGLGLVIVKNAIDAHDGQISVVSKEGEGTTFTIELPLPRL